MTSYELSRDWFNWCFENPEKISPTHTAMYFFIIEHCNRLGWKEKFGLPMEMTKDAIGIKNYRTFSNTFNDLVEWGFIIIHEKSKNQYSANIIALVKNTKAHTKALDKAMSKHLQKQEQKQVHGIVGIDKPINLEPLTIEQESGGEKKSHTRSMVFDYDKLVIEFQNSGQWQEEVCMALKMQWNDINEYLKTFLLEQRAKDNLQRSFQDIKCHFVDWLKKQKNGKISNPQVNILANSTFLK